ncbi:MAG: stage V sporulation protein E, partial [Pseudomonadota bacterium]
MNNLENRSARPDYIFMVMVVLLVLFGLVMDFSSSFIVAGQKYGDPFYLVKKHFVFMLIGVA